MFGLLLMIGIVLIVRPPFLFPVITEVQMDPFWDYTADATRGNSTVVLFDATWLLSPTNGKYYKHIYWDT
jgi:hypothetical protein